MGKVAELTLDMLKVRTSDHDLVSVGEGHWGETYAEYLKNAGTRNIVWKRRQLGMTTLALARGFMKAVQGKECLIVAHGSEDYLWNMVEVFIDTRTFPLPLKWMNRQSRTFGLEGKSPSQFQIVDFKKCGFSRGKRFDFIHFQEFAWWSLKEQKTAWLSLGPCLNPDAEVIIESTPPLEGGGMFRDIWNAPDHYGFTRHWFPWWRNAKFAADAVDEKSLTMEEQDLKIRYDLKLEQIGWRRKALEQYMMLYGSSKQFKAEYSEESI